MKKYVKPTLLVEKPNSGIIASKCTCSGNTTHSGVK